MCPVPDSLPTADATISAARDGPNHAFPLEGFARSARCSDAWVKVKIGCISWVTHGPGFYFDSR
jgi:hypothetical protein